MNIFKFLFKRKDHKASKTESVFEELFFETCNEGLAEYVKFISNTFSQGKLDDCSAPSEILRMIILLSFKQSHFQFNKILLERSYREFTNDQITIFEEKNIDIIVDNLLLQRENWKVSFINNSTGKTFTSIL